MVPELRLNVWFWLYLFIVAAHCFHHHRYWYLYAARENVIRAQRGLVERYQERLNLMKELEEQELRTAMHLADLSFEDRTRLWSQVKELAVQQMQKKDAGGLN